MEIYRQFWRMEDMVRASSIDLSFLDDDDDYERNVPLATSTPTPTPVKAKAKAKVMVPPGEKFLAVRDITDEHSVHPSSDDHGLKVRARVTNKRLVPAYNENDKSVLNMAILDDTGEIRCFVDEASAASFDRALREGQIYIFSRFVVTALTPLNKNFTSCLHPYQILMDHNTRVELCPKSSSYILPLIPRLHYNFMSIPEAKVTPKNTTIDVYGLCESMKDLETGGGDYDDYLGWDVDTPRKSLMITDRSNKKIRVTVYGESATKNLIGTLVSFKGVEVIGGKWNRHLRMRRSGCIEINPVELEAERADLCSWSERKRKERNKRCTSSLHRQAALKVAGKAEAQRVLPVSGSTSNNPNLSKRPRIISQLQPKSGAESSASLSFSSLPLSQSQSKGSLFLRRSQEGNPQSATNYVNINLNNSNSNVNERSQTVIVRRVRNNETGEYTYEEDYTVNRFKLC